MDNIVHGIYGRRPTHELNGQTVSRKIFKIWQERQDSIPPYLELCKICAEEMAEKPVVKIEKRKPRADKTKVQKKKEEVKKEILE